MAVYALYEAINALAIEIDMVRIRAMTNCCRKFKTMQLQAVCLRVGGFFLLKKCLTKLANSIQ